MLNKKEVKKFLEDRGWKLVQEYENKNPLIVDPTGELAHVYCYAHQTYRFGFSIITHLNDIYDSLEMHQTFFDKIDKGHEKVFELKEEYIFNELENLTGLEDIYSHYIHGEENVRHSYLRRKQRAKQVKNIQTKLKKTYDLLYIYDENKDTAIIMKDTIKNEVVATIDYRRETMKVSDLYISIELFKELGELAAYELNDIKGDNE